MTIDDYLASPMLADPLRLFDSCLISDGGAAYVTTSVERARDLPQPPAVVLGVGEGYSRRGRALGAAARVHEHAAGVLARRGAFAMAGITPADVDVLTVYDPFTVVSLMQIEDMGFCPKGEAGAFVEGDTLAPRRGQAAVQHARRAALARVRARHRARRRVREAAARHRAPRRCPTARSRCTAATPATWRARSCSTKDR